MKFKYYLKGIGMGIIFTTIVLSVSFAMHDDDLSDKEIIEKAEALGMVMPESESEGGLFESQDDSESESEEESESERTTQSEHETESESTSSSEAMSEAESERETES